VNPVAAPADDPAHSKFMQLRPAASPLSAAVSAWITSTQLTLSYDADLDACWALTTTDGLPPGLVQRWRHNGLRLAILPRAQLPEFEKALPRLLNSRKLLAPGGPSFTTAWSGPAIREAREVFLALGDDASDEPHKLDRGRLQLVARFTPSKDAAPPTFELMPHHHRPRLSIQPRPPEEELLDGRLIEELALRGVVDADRLLIISLIKPAPPQPPSTPQQAQSPDSEASPPADPDAPRPPPPPEAGDAARGEPAQRDPTKPVVPPLPALPVLPPHLGAAMLAGLRLNRPVHSVVLIELRPAEPRPSTHASPGPAPSEPPR
jgi:hypothetical protein